MHTLRHVFVLHEFEDDVGLCRVGIEAGIPRLVVAFVEDNGIFALGYFQIGIRFCQTQCPGGGSFGRPVFGQGIGMYGDEQISYGVIGNFSAPVQGDEYVPVPRIDNFYIRAVLLDLFAKFEIHDRPRPLPVRQDPLHVVSPQHQ